MASPRTASAQFMVAGVPAGDDEQANQQLPFLLPVQPTEIGEAMEDFRRFAGRKQWEKAFKHLEKVFNATSTGLVLTADGIMLPSRMIAREALLELPTAGQDAYRLFFDAEAKKLLEQAQGPEELTKLSQIFSRFLVTSVGDKAADKLGDLHFEAGNFAQAINAWRSILEERPDSSISRARLRVKIGTALAREGHWAEFRKLLKVAEEQHAGEKLTLGGREVSVVEHLRGLAEKHKDAAAAPQTAGGPVADIPLAGNPQPLWQFQFFPPPEGDAQPGLRMQQMWWGGAPSVSDMVPPVAADQSRVYANLLGYDLGIDLDNGKLLWRSGRFFDVPQKAQQGGLSSAEHFGLAAGSGRTWSVEIDTKNPNQNQNMMMMRGGQGGAKFEIVAREADTGKQVFSSQQSTELKDWTLRGSPLLVGERVFVAASKVQQPNELDVLALGAKDGKLLWSSVIGNYTNQGNMWWGMVERGNQPSLLFHDGRLYVDSHSGSMVQLDAASGEVEWGLNYLAETTQQHRFWSPWGMRTEQFTVSPPQVVGGVLYVKGMRSRQMYAVDPTRPKVLWHRPVPKTATIIGIDEKRFYLGGEDISAFDLATRKILWSVRVDLGTTWARPLVTQGRIYHFSSRGIFEIDKESGNVVTLFRGADLKSLGGELLVTPKALLAVSNLAVTAYPLGEATPSQKPEAPAAQAAAGGEGGASSQ